MISSTDGVPGDAGASAVAAREHAVIYAQAGTLRYRIAATALATYLLVPALVIPVAIAALVDGLKITDAAASLLQSATTIASVIAGALLGLFLLRMNRRWVAATGVGVMLAANVLMALYPTLTVIATLRPVESIGATLALGLAYGYLGFGPRPERTFGVFTTVGTVVQAAATPAVPWLFETFGLPGLFTIPLVLAPVALWAIATLPARLPRGTSPGAAAPATATPLSARAYAGVAAAIGGWVLWHVYIAAIFTFSARIGQQAGIGAQDVGNVLAVATLFSLIGAVSATAVGERFGRTLPLVMGTVLGLAACWSTATASTIWSFGLAMLLFNAAWSWGNIYFFGLVARADTTGRFTVLLNTITNVVGAGVFAAMAAITAAGGLPPTSTAIYFSAAGAALSLIAGAIAVAGLRGRAVAP